MSVLLHGIEHLAYGYSSGSFLDAAAAAPPARRVIALGIAGIVGGLGWWTLRRWGRAVVPVEASVAGARMPRLVTVANAALQIVIVGLGASIGRELAPRELGALIAGWLSERTGLTARQRRVLVACGAGAGLAAVYNVPLGGAVFALEVLLGELSLTTALTALATAAIATLFVDLIAPTGPIYTLPAVTPTPTLLVWSLLAGPVIGFAAVGFLTTTRTAVLNRISGKWILVIMPAVFLAVGLLSIPFPALLGNGRALGQVAFDATSPLLILGALLLVKALATTGTIFSGAAGGTLTPSLALGATLGAILGTLWSAIWPGAPIAAFALVAASAFLASSMRAPLTALILVAEFTAQGWTLLLPSMVAIVGSLAISHLFHYRRIAGVP